MRWLIRRDMPEVLLIEQCSFEHPWSEEDFLDMLRQRNCVGQVVEIDDEVVGYMLYMLHKGKLELSNIAVSPEFRNKGVGKQMVEKLQNKLHPDRRTSIFTDVRDSNLGAHLFFKSMGFVATEIVPNPFEMSNDDAYRFIFRISWKNEGEDVAIYQ